MIINPSHAITKFFSQYKRPVSLAIEPNKITNPTGRGVVGGALNEGGKEVFETELFLHLNMLLGKKKGGKLILLNLSIKTNLGFFFQVRYLPSSHFCQ